MLAHAPKPVLRVAIVRLTTMHDAMQKTSVGAGELLRKRVRGIEMIVPKQRRAPHRLLCFRRQGSKQRIKLLVQDLDGLRVWPRLRTQVRWLRGGDKLSQLVKFRLLHALVS